MKKLSNLPMYLGDMLHKSIYTLLSHYRFKELPPIETIEKHIRNRLNQSYRYSRDKQLWHQKPKEIPLLRELVYGEEIGRETIEDMIHRLQQCLGNLYESRSFQDAMYGNHINLYESEQFHAFRFNEIKIYVVMDLLYQDEKRDKWIIVDWKTGRESMEDRNQLALYSLYLHEKDNIPHHKIKVRNEYLASGEQRENSIQTNDLDQVNEIMLMSIIQMLQYMEDVKRNKPVSINLFEKSEHPKKCSMCNFRSMCERDI
ncbi:PD-(D/E)XK nuclease family protein [Ectobacillus panaciterrae]|uniref:PD-(D/E)XK nuclease family protein n=1 Tax=Ectobacillus panaciterrae TaxID=363872 RepID=UPI00048CC0F6|nr:PD-(D/E)XK nuclease family protein [Ectobacillus panaciterrae]